jgi:hypothetical protein
VRAEGDTIVTSTNGKVPHTAEGHGAEVVAALRRRPTNVHLFRGFGTLVAGAVLFVLMLWLAPSVAPEHIVDKPIGGPTTTVAPTTTAPTATTAPTVTTAEPTTDETPTSEVAP